MPVVRNVINSCFKTVADLGRGLASYLREQVDKVCKIFAKNVISQDVPKYPPTSSSHDIRPIVSSNPGDISARIVMVKNGLFAESHVTCERDFLKKYNLSEEQFKQIVVLLASLGTTKRMFRLRCEQLQIAPATVNELEKILSNIKKIQEQNKRV